MRVSILVMVSAHIVTLSSAFAAAVDFPYEAVVQSDRVIVLSGPGEAYHPTSKLSAGQRVTVHRHEPGGWFMIDPPPGSFSWIDARFVETSGDGRGVVKVPSQGGNLPPRVEVWFGSQFTNEFRHWGRRLATGDEVTILGEMIQQTAEGPITFYKIEPPRLEYRWVKGNFVLPVSEVAKTQPHFLKSDLAESSLETVDASGDQPFVAKNRPAPPGFDIEPDTQVRQRKGDPGSDGHAFEGSAKSAGQFERDRGRLRQLDEQLDGMLAGGPGQWRLEEIEQAYRTLQASAGPGIAGMIDARLAAIETRKPIQSEYDAFVAITTRTDRRDAELMALQNAAATGIPVSASGVAVGAIQPISSRRRPPGSQFARNEFEAPAHGFSGADFDRLDGAGIISRASHPRPGLPPHILVAPDGRLLAYLQADRGINLDDYLGQSVGLVGRRSHEPRLRSDLIHITRLTPVRLQR